MLKFLFPHCPSVNPWHVPLLSCFVSAQAQTSEHILEHGVQAHSVLAMCVASQFAYCDGHSAQQDQRFRWNFHLGSHILKTEVNALHANFLRTSTKMNTTATTRMVSQTFSLAAYVAPEK